MSLKKQGFWLVIATAVISGFSIFMNSFAVKGFDSSVFTFSKNLVVALFLIALILGFGYRNELWSLKKKQWLQLLIIGFVGGSVPFLLFFKGLQLTTGSTSAFIHKTLFLLVIVLATVFLKEKLTKSMIAASLLLMAGTYFMVKPNFSFSYGHLLVAGAVIFWAIENTYAKYVLKEVSGTVVAFGRMFFGSLFILIFLAVSGKLSLVASMSQAQYLWILVTSVFLLLYVLTFYNGLKHIQVSTATAVLTIGAPITTLLTWIFRGTTVSSFEAFGILCIGAGTVLILLPHFLSWGYRSEA